MCDRFEEERDVRPQHQQATAHGKEPAECEPAPHRIMEVVINEDARPVDPVQHRQHEHRQVIPTPQHPGVSIGDKPVVDLIDAVDQMHQGQVAQREKQQDHAGEAHEDPRPQLEAPGWFLSRERNRFSHRLTFLTALTSDFRLRTSYLTMWRPMMTTTGIIMRTNNAIWATK